MKPLMLSIGALFLLFVAYHGLRGLAQSYLDYQKWLAKEKDAAEATRKIDTSV